VRTGSGNPRTRRQRPGNSKVASGSRCAASIGLRAVPTDDFKASAPPSGLGPALPAESDGEFSILAVCTGNVCRSPAVERLLAGRLGATVRVSSAGTHALVSHPISPQMAELLREGGVDERPFEARRLSEDLLKAADLVLPMTRAQRGIVVQMWPAAVRRTFTLREFARLLSRVDAAALPEGTPAERLRAAVPLAAAERGGARKSPDEDDVIDPFRLSDEVYATSFRQITSAVDAIVGALLPA
jgi:protein-tyrosine phosphatase